MYDRRKEAEELKRK